MAQIQTFLHHCIRIHIKLGFRGIKKSHSTHSLIFDMVEIEFLLGY